MRANGNTTQWVNGYPSAALIREDMARGVGYAIEEAGELVGVFAFIKGEDPTYATIYDGSWTDTMLPYGTIHRLACALGHHGVAKTCLQWCEQQVPKVRFDTHADNLILQHIAAKYGYTYCGIIYIADGTPRMAYEKIIGDKK